MEVTNIIRLCEDFGFPYKSYLDKVKYVGDVCALRKNPNGVAFRRNYERALVVMAVAHKYDCKRFLEFGTGRGFVTGCASMLKNIQAITTIDKEPYRPTEKKMSKLDCIDLSKIEFISNNSYSVTKTDLGRNYDLVFIDGEHTGRAVRHDFELSSHCSSGNAIFVFDDYRDKHEGVKRYIETLNYKKILVQSDGWLYENVMIDSHGDANRVENGKEYDSGQVILIKDE